VPSAKSSSAKPAATIVTATAKTRSVIEDLQARLTAVVTADPVAAEQESIEDLERELEAYFRSTGPKPENGSQNPLFDDLRKRVIDGVVDRILAEWANSQPGPDHGLAREVIDRLIDRVLIEFRKNSQTHPV
jgi:hypothetical protein